MTGGSPSAAQRERRSTGWVLPGAVDCQSRLHADYRASRLPDNRVSIRPQPSKHAGRRTTSDHQQIGVLPLHRAANYVRSVACLDRQFRLGAKALLQAKPHILARRAQRLSSRQRSPGWSLSCEQVVACTTVSRAPNSFCMRVAHSRVRQLCGPRSIAQTMFWKATPGSGKVRSMWTPVHTGQSASCNTLAVIDPKMNCRKGPYPCVGMTIRSTLCGYA